MLTIGGARCLTDGIPCPCCRGAVDPPREAPASKAPAKRRRPLGLDAATVLGAEGLTQEVALLRAAIRRLAMNDDAAEDVKILAELRHQVEALCRVLKTQHELDDDDAAAADLAQALEALGDGLGVPR